MPWMAAACVLFFFFSFSLCKMVPGYAVKLLNINEPKNKSRGTNDHDPQAVVQVCLDTSFLKVT